MAILKDGDQVIIQDREFQNGVVKLSLTKRRTTGSTLIAFRVYDGEKWSTAAAVELGELLEVLQKLYS